MFKKFNWGHGLLLFIISFMAGMLYLVSLCFKQDFDLVSKDYYEKEIAYQQQINRSENAAALSTSVQISFDTASSSIHIELPKEFSETSTRLHVYLYKPDNASLDKTLEVQTTGSHAYIPSSGLKTGLWRIQLNWSKEGKEFYNESDIHIQ